MNTDNDTSPMFANESTVFRIVSIAKVLSWVILVIYLILFANDLSPIIQRQVTLPTQPSQWPVTIASLFYAPALGLFYFLVLQTVAQGLNLGLDIYYELQPEDDEEAEE